ncbi:MAG: P-loop NTPase [Clostridia bacterium]|nr:P-loop NTPase [Clostridia bacterium]
MNHTEIRVVTSAKGGVGKSTVCANLGAALAMRGKRVLLIDCDTANRSLDLLLGVQDSVLYSYFDVLAGRCSAAQAMTSVPGMEDSLFLLPGGHADKTSLDKDAFAYLLAALPKENDACIFDYIYIDTPGGMRDLLTAAASIAEEALIISSAQSTAIRSAEQTASLLSVCGIPSQKLIINAFMEGECFFTHTKRRKQKQILATKELFDVVDTVALPLLGVIPFDADVWSAQNNGLLIGHPAYRKKPFLYAFQNIAARLEHRYVPLFTTS